MAPRTSHQSSIAGGGGADWFLAFCGDSELLRVGDERLREGAAWATVARCEQADGVALGEAVEAVGLAAGADVQIDVVGGGGGGDDGIMQVLLAQGVKLVGDAPGRR